MVNEVADIFRRTRLLWLALGFRFLSNMREALFLCPYFCENSLETSVTITDDIHDIHCPVYCWFTELFINPAEFTPTEKIFTRYQIDLHPNQ